MDYYDGLWTRLSTASAQSEWTRLERGIFAGCTLSVILFLAGFNILIEFVSAKRFPSFQLENGNSLPLLRGFMDDLSVMTTGVPYGREILERVEFVLEWARMKPKASKSRSCVIIKGRCMNVEPFVVGNEVIPSLQRKPLRTMGRDYDASLTDINMRVDLVKQINDGLRCIDKSFATGIMKLFTYQTRLLPKICWPIMIHEIPLSWVEKYDKRICVFFRKWLGVSKSLSSVALFSKDSPLPLPLTSLETEFKRRKVGALFSLKHSTDKNISLNIPKLKTGRKFDAEKCLNDAEIDINVDKLVGTKAIGRRGLGSRKKTERLQKMIGNKVRLHEDQRLYAKAVNQKVQGKWTQWKSLIQRDMSWSALLRSSRQILSFSLGVTYDTLGTPVNLKRWNLVDSDTCDLCESRCSVQHILSGC